MAAAAPVAQGVGAARRDRGTGAGRLEGRKRTSRRRSRRGWPSPRISRQVSDLAFERSFLCAAEAEAARLQIGKTRPGEPGGADPRISGSTSTRCAGRSRRPELIAALKHVTQLPEVVVCGGGPNPGIVEDSKQQKAPSVSVLVALRRRSQRRRQTASGPRRGNERWRAHSCRPPVAGGPVDAGRRPAFGRPMRPPRQSPRPIGRPLRATWCVGEHVVQVGEHGPCAPQFVLRQATEIVAQRLPDRLHAFPAPVAANLPPEL